MLFRLDENLSLYLKPLICALGHDVKTVAEENLLSQPDSVIAAAAKNENRWLLTLDIGFADLRKYPPGSHQGIILFRPKTYGPLAVNRYIEEFIRKTEFETLAGCTVIVEPLRVRVRRPPLDTESEGWKEYPLCPL